MVRKRQFTCIPLVIGIVVSCICACVSANGLRGSSSDQKGTIHCRITVLDSLFWSEDGNEETSSETVCIPTFHGEEGHEAFPYAVELPDNILKDFEDEIELGKLHVSISHAEFDGDSISTGKESEFSVHEEHESRRLSHKPYNQTIGTRTLAIVTVSTTNGQHVSHNHETLERYLFSEDQSMVRQYHHCSLGQLTWKFAGAYDVVIQGDVSDYESPSHMRNVALEKLVEDGRVKRSAQELGDNVMIILPKGTSGFIANAGMNYWLSVFNDVWSLDLLTVVHELAHNLGLGHAGWGPAARYGDFSSMMSSTGREPQHHGPLRCFNGAENDELGWFARRSVKAKAKPHSEVVEIAAFSQETSHTFWSRNIPLLVGIDESAYLVYNKASHFNAGTLLFKDSVTVTVKKNGSTDMLGAVKAGGSDLTIPNFQGGNETLRIRACQHVQGEGDVPDHMVVSFGYTKILCGDEEATTKPASSDENQASNRPSIASTTPGTTTSSTATHSTPRPTAETTEATNVFMATSDSTQGTASTAQSIPQVTEDSSPLISTETTRTSDQSTPGNSVLFLTDIPKYDGVVSSTAMTTEMTVDATSSTAVPPCRGRAHTDCSMTEPEVSESVTSDESDSEQQRGRGRAFLPSLGASIVTGGTTTTEATTSSTTTTTTTTTTAASATEVETSQATNEMTTMSTVAMATTPARVITFATEKTESSQATTETTTIPTEATTSATTPTNLITFQTSTTENPQSAKETATTTTTTTTVASTTSTATTTAATTTTSINLITFSAKGISLPQATTAATATATANPTTLMMDGTNQAEATTDGTDASNTFITPPTEASSETPANMEGTAGSSDTTPSTITGVPLDDGGTGSTTTNRDNDECPPTGSLNVSVISKGERVTIRCDQISTLREQAQVCTQTNLLEPDNPERVYRICTSQCRVQCIGQ
eukprot:scaffold766_cov179-Amphora_coffeaeformis.AAC.18